MHFSRKLSIQNAKIKEKEKQQQQKVSHSFGQQTSSQILLKCNSQKEISVSNTLRSVLLLPLFCQTMDEYSHQVILIMFFLMWVNSTEFIFPSWGLNLKKWGLFISPPPVKSETFSFPFLALRQNRTQDNTEETALACYHWKSMLPSLSLAGPVECNVLEH